MTPVRTPDPCLTAFVQRAGLCALALLLTVGITWESRMTDVRRASRYVGALR